MSKYPTKKHRYKKGKKYVPRTFDASQLSAKEKAILQQFQERKSSFETYKKEFHTSKHICPSCAYPSLVNRYDYEVCIICGWEDCGTDDEHNLVLISAPNYISLLEARVNIGKLLEQFQQNTNAPLPTNCQLINQSIDSFHEQLFKKKVSIVPDFHKNLQNILSITTIS